MHNALELKQDALRFIAQYSNGVIVVSFLINNFYFSSKIFLVRLSYSNFFGKLILTYYFL